ncbi:hypothetical protein SGRA_4117 [Saprospira grandis str. Lewin]|uniref:Uncharacterized protein n=1 Tax=Saprospira grandis (strain Lewin) TaxID=984262 RepID=H6L7G0_SAPGL|nr:hypothetical protein SGRA_4117 [Saprospira grandis str. Lewin]
MGQNYPAAEENSQKKKDRCAKGGKAAAGPALRSGWPKARPSKTSASEVLRRAEQTCEPRSIAAASLLAAGPKNPSKKSLFLFGISLDKHKFAAVKLFLS